MADSDLKQKREEIKAQYKANGSADMSDKELLEAALTMSLCGKDGKSSADTLMKEYGSLKSLFSVSPNRLISSGNIDEKTAVYISLMRHIKAKCELNKNAGVKVLRSNESLVKFAKNMLSHQASERVILVTLDDKRKLIKADYISNGNTNFASVMPADISRRIIDEKPKYVFVAHNHLIDSCVASFADINFTINLSNWLAQFEIKLIDHIIVGKTQAVSMAQDEEYSFIFN